MSEISGLFIGIGMMSVFLVIAYLFYQVGRLYKTIADKERRLTEFLEGTIRRIKGKPAVVLPDGTVYEFDAEVRWGDNDRPIVDKNNLPEAVRLESYKPKGSSKATKSFEGQSELDKTNQEIEDIERRLGIGK